MTAGGERCVCGLVAPPVTGAVDPYGASTPACWAAFGQLLAADDSGWQPHRHRLTVDAYMAQHPGFGSPGGRRSALIHLVGLWLALERQVPAGQVRPILGLVFPDKQAVPPEVVPIPALSGLNVASVLDAAPEAHEARVEAWARFVWGAWRPHHELVVRLAGEALERVQKKRPSRKKSISGNG